MPFIGRGTLIELMIRYCRPRSHLVTLLVYMNQTTPVEVRSRNPQTLRTKMILMKRSNAVSSPHTYYWGCIAWLAKLRDFGGSVILEVHSNRKPPIGRRGGGGDGTSDGGDGRIGGALEGAVPAAVDRTIAGSPFIVAFLHTAKMTGGFFFSMENAFLIPSTGRLPCLH